MCITCAVPIHLAVTIIIFTVFDCAASVRPDRDVFRRAHDVPRSRKGYLRVGKIMALTFQQDHHLKLDVHILAVLMRRQ